MPANPQGVGSRWRQQGSAARGCLLALAVPVAIVVIMGLVGVGKYNALVGQREAADAAWSEIDNQYKRRYDLIPNLIETVKGAADFEKSTLQAVVDARASVGKVQLPAKLPTDPAQLDAYIQAQQGLGSALGRMFAVAENYPQLKTTQNFLSLQDQLEGTENRIAVARRDYIDAVRRYNTSLKSFPANLIAGTFGFEEASQLKVEAETRTVPKVKFDEKK